MGAFTSFKNTKKILSIFLILSTLSGCFNKNPVPIAYNCPKIVLPKSPLPIIYTLKKSATPDEIIKAWVTTTIQYKAWHDTVVKQVNLSN